MKLTKQMLEAGKSDAGGFNLKQLKALGLPLPAKGWPPAGWPARLIGSEVTDAQYQEFLALRNTKNVPQGASSSLSSVRPEGRGNVLDIIRSNGAQQFPGDRNLESVKAKMDERAKVGFAKYGVTTERTDIDLLGWLIHLQEEQMDSLLYIEAAIQKLRGQIAGRKLLNEIDPPTESAEDFTNNLFEQTERNLA